MPNSEFWRCSATELSEMIERKEISPTEVLAGVLTRVGRLNPVVNALVTIDVEGARACAEASNVAKWQANVSAGWTASWLRSRTTSS